MITWCIFHPFEYRESLELLGDSVNDPSLCTHLPQLACSLSAHISYCLACLWSFLGSVPTQD